MSGAGPESQDAILAELTERETAWFGGPDERADHLGWPTIDAAAEREAAAAAPGAADERSHDERTADWAATEGWTHFGDDEREPGR